MSGHSKWANIKRKKGITDKARGIAFAKLSRIITLSVIEGGNIPDPNHNFKLRLAIDKAHALNMPKENIARAIEKGIGSEKALLREVLYEGFAPHGIALMIQATTDNPNRTVSEMKNMCEMNGGKLGSQGSVSYLFDHCGMVEFEKTTNSEDAVFAFGEALNATDIEDHESSYIVYFPFHEFGRIKEHIGSMVTITSEVDYRPQSTITLADDSQIKSVLGLVEKLEELDDVQRVFTNLEIPDSFHE